MKPNVSKLRARPKKAPAKLPLAKPAPAKPAAVKLQAATAARRAPSRQIVEDTHYDDEFEPSMKLSRAFVIVLIMHVVAVGGIFAFNAIKTRQLSENRSDKELTPHVADETANAGSATRNTENSAPPVPAIPASRRHVVKPNETPYGLAKTYGVKIEDLLAVNHLSESSPIVIGQELKIPDSARGMTAPAPQSAPPAPTTVRVANTAATAPRQAPAQAPAPNVDADVQDLLGVKEGPKPPAQRSPDKNSVATSGKTYTVAKGDNPYSIAKKLGVDPADLLRANNIDDPKKLQIGQQLKVPTK